MLVIPAICGNPTGPDHLLTGKGGVFAGKYAVLAGVDGLLAGKDAEFAGVDGLLAGMDSAIAGKDYEFAGVDAMIAGKDGAITGKGSDFAGIDAFLAGMDREFAGKGLAVTGRDMSIAELRMSNVSPPSDSSCESSALSAAGTDLIDLSGRCPVRVGANGLRAGGHRRNLRLREFVWATVLNGLRPAGGRGKGCRRSIGGRPCMRPGLNGLA